VPWGGGAWGIPLEGGEKELSCKQGEVIKKSKKEHGIAEKKKRRHRGKWTRESAFHRGPHRKGESILFEGKSTEEEKKEKRRECGKQKKEGCASSSAPVKEGRERRKGKGRPPRGRWGRSKGKTRSLPEKREIRVHLWGGGKKKEFNWLSPKGKGRKEDCTSAEGIERERMSKEGGKDASHATKTKGVGRQSLYLLREKKEM